MVGDLASVTLGVSYVVRKLYYICVLFLILRNHQETMISEEINVTNVSNLLRYCVTPLYLGGLGFLRERIDFRSHKSPEIRAACTNHRKKLRARAQI